jgi:hypothetical protein
MEVLMAFGTDVGRKLMMQFNLIHTNMDKVIQEKGESRKHLLFS